MSINPINKSKIKAYESVQIRSFVALLAHMILAIVQFRLLPYTIFYCYNHIETRV